MISVTTRFKSRVNHPNPLPQSNPSGFIYDKYLFNKHKH